MLISTADDLRCAEAELVHAAKSGDRSAFGALYERYGRMVHAILLAHVSYTEAEDLVQDVFVRAFEQLHSLRNPAAFGAWISAIARRAAIDSHRRRKPVREMTEIPGGARPDEQSFAILRAIQSLPKAYRETLLLRLVEGMTGPEIAERTGLTADSVRVNLCRGMKQLREALRGKAEL